ncbi:PKD domain-containing protein [Arthrobacter sp. TMN-37]
MVRVFGIAAAALAVLGLILVAIVLFNRDDPVAAKASEIRFTAAGDFAARGDTGAVLTKNESLSPDFTLALGDLSYGSPGEEQAWCDFVTSRVGVDFPFQLIAGNHESDGSDGNINDFSACLPNRLPGMVGTYGRQWYVDVPAKKPLARFVMVSPGLTFAGDEPWDYRPGSDHHAWTEAAIDGARDTGIPWVIVGNHLPCLSIGEYGCEAGEEFTNMLISKKVDLVLNAHEHLYQRTFQLGHRDGCPEIVADTVNEDCIADTDKSLAQGAGTVFATVGTGGVKLRDANKADPEADYFAASSGANANPTYGLLDVSVTEKSISADFVQAAVGTFKDSFKLTRNPDSARGPEATFTEECGGLACSLDASTPFAAQGNRSYAWDFGNGETATGVRPTVTYDAPGTYQITVTVKDDTGSATSSTSVSVADGKDGTASTFSDEFERTSTSGWGEADDGGAWTDGGNPGALLVEDGQGALQLAAADSAAAAFLGSTNSSRLDLRATVGVDKSPVDGSLYLRLVTRQTDRAGAYRTVLQFSRDGGLLLSIDRVSGDGTETTLGSRRAVPDVTVTGGETFNVRTQATGTSPTTLRAKVWKAGEDEPSEWQIETSDSAPGLQITGSVGLTSSLSARAANAPITVRVDEITGSVAE